MHAVHSAQIVVQGIPWAYTWKELKDMFAEDGDVERADVAIGHDGRSRVSIQADSGWPWCMQQQQWRHHISSSRCVEANG